MKILIGADIVPTETNFDIFSSGNIEEIVDGDLLELFHSVDFRIFDLECVLSDRPANMIKCGPRLLAPPEAINGISKLGIDLLTIANNHIMDGGKTGLFDTIKAIKEKNIHYIGAGENVKEAAKPYIIDKDCKIGVYACAEHEFSIAGDSTPGANPADLLTVFDDVAELKKQVDHVIVLYHGGREHYRYPSPRLQKICRKLIDAGASLVLTQHSHCIGCEEKYQNGIIVYGQGNFIFDKSENEFRNSGLLLKTDFAKDGFSVEYVPLEKNANGVRCAAEKSIIEGFFARGEEIKADGFIEKRYQEEAAKFIDTYLMYFHGKRSFASKVLCRLFGKKYVRAYCAKHYKTNDLAAILNYISCEPHSEIVSNGLLDRISAALDK